MKKLIKNLLESLNERHKYQKKIYELDNDIRQIIVRLKKKMKEEKVKKKKSYKMYCEKCMCEVEGKKKI